jgi:hypothetical protein
MTPAARVHLDRRIAEERMLELDRHGEEPDDLEGVSSTVFVIGMDATGKVSRAPLDEVQWHTLAAYRLENVHGARVELDQIGEVFDEFDEDGHVE